MNKNKILQSYRGKRVLVTGHTGFKGSWLCLVLQMAGAEVSGYAMEPNAAPSVFRLAGIEDKMHSVIGDIRDLDKLKQTFDICKPEYVFHLAAQPIVREGYKNPVDTYSTNVMGTVNLLECVRQSDSVKTMVNITTDKVYLDKETGDGYREDDKLDGYDPYSNSKSCSELVTHSYYKSYLQERDIRISTARAGNVIGGGDFEKDRIIPDCIRAALAGENIVVRNPYSVRPYQHVLEPLSVYLMIAQKQLGNSEYQGAYNVGPDKEDCWATGKLVDCFCQKWGEDISWVNLRENGPYEAGILKLDCSKLKRTFSWHPKWDIETAMDKIVEWARIYQEKGGIRSCMEKQVQEFFISG